MSFREGWHFDLRSQGGLRRRDWNIHQQVASFAMEIGMGRDVHCEQEVAGRPAGRSRMPLAGKSDYAAIFDTRRNLDVEAFGLLAAADLQPMAAPFGGNLERHRDVESQVFPLVSASELLARAEGSLSGPPSASTEGPALKPAARFPRAP